MSSQRPDPQTPASVYLVLVTCAALSVVLTWPRAMQQPEAERVGYLFGMGFAALGLPLLSGWIGRKLGIRPGPAIVIVALGILGSRVTATMQSAADSEAQARAEPAASGAAPAGKPTIDARVIDAERAVAASETAMVAAGKPGADVIARLMQDLLARTSGYARQFQALEDAGGCDSRGLDSVAAIDARLALITSARSSAETTGEFLRGFMANAERDLQAANVPASEIADFRRDVEADGQSTLVVQLCEAQARQFRACETALGVLREHFGRWADGPDNLVFKPGMPDAAVATFNSAAAAINAEVVTIADLEAKRVAARAAKPSSPRD